MEIVKVKKTFYEKCKENGTADELLFNQDGRPCVLIVKIKYKGNIHKFVVPIRSNISGSTPNSQYFSLPPNPNTRKGCAHGVHYIKLFPIKDEYIDNYDIDKSTYMLLIKSIIDRNEKEIIKNCQEYLKLCEIGSKNKMTPDIDGILRWL